MAKLRRPYLRTKPHSDNSQSTCRSEDDGKHERSQLPKPPPRAAKLWFCTLRSIIDIPDERPTAGIQNQQRRAVVLSHVLQYSRLLPSTASAPSTSPPASTAPLPTSSLTRLPASLCTTYTPCTDGLGARRALAREILPTASRVSPQVVAHASPETWQKKRTGTSAERRQEHGEKCCAPQRRSSEDATEQARHFAVDSPGWPAVSGTGGRGSSKHGGRGRAASSRVPTVHTQSGGWMWREFNRFSEFGRGSGGLMLTPTEQTRREQARPRRRWRSLLAAGFVLLLACVIAAVRERVVQDSSRTWAVVLATRLGSAKAEAGSRVSIAQSAM